MSPYTPAVIYDAITSLCEPVKLRSPYGSILAYACLTSCPVANAWAACFSVACPIVASLPSFQAGFPISLLILNQAGWLNCRNALTLYMKYCPRELGDA